MLFDIVLKIIVALPLVVTFAPKAISPVFFLLGVILVIHNVRGKAVFGERAVPRLMQFGMVVLAYMGCSLLWSPDALSGLERLVRLIAEIYVAYLLYSFVSERSQLQMQLISRSMYMGLVASSLILLIEFKTGGLIRELLHIQSLANDGDLSDYNRAVSYLLIMSLVYLYMKSSHTLFVTDLFLFMAVGCVVMMSSSGTSQLAAFAAVLSYWIFLLFSRKAILRILQSGLLIVAMLLPLTVHVLPDWPVFQNKMLHLDRSERHRLLIWDFASSKIYEKPVFGWGFDASPRIPGGRDLVSVDLPRNMTASMQNLPSHPHNFIIQLWLELGLVGTIVCLLLFVKFLAALFVHCPDNRQARAVLGSLIIVVFTTASFGYGLWQSQWIAAIFLAASFALSVKDQSLV